MLEIISPSNYKPGYAHITQGWPNYHSGKDAVIGRKHKGIDITCGYKDYSGARALVIEGGKVIKIRPGSDSRVGYVAIRGNPSDQMWVYKHIGKFF